MSENIQKSPSLNQMVDAFTHLKQRLEYFERHIQNSNNQEVRKEYFPPPFSIQNFYNKDVNNIQKCLVRQSVSYVEIVLDLH